MGNGRLSHVQNSGDVADAELVLGQQRDDPEAGRVRHHLEYPREVRGHAPVEGAPFELFDQIGMNALHIADVFLGGPGVFAAACFRSLP